MLQNRGEGRTVNLALASFIAYLQGVLLQGEVTHVELGLRLHQWGKREVSLVHWGQGNIPHSSASASLTPFLLKQEEEEAYRMALAPCLLIGSFSLTGRRQKVKGASPVAQTVKNLPAVWETQV